MKEKMLTMNEGLNTHSWLLVLPIRLKVQPGKHHKKNNHTDSSAQDEQRNILRVEESHNVEDILSLQMKEGPLNICVIQFNHRNRKATQCRGTSRPS